ncbi:alpha/beta hydrolase [Spirochaeta cellobiosiphila]|uniref:alpha/beta hydrolase n=1 Tax=Spirochaeta cellobiosiphila TaxID=504483 RepID=UPI0003FE9F1A|nr:alpha/beta fold hydrolase [Spirochaeta cellobiosiphila]
MNLPEINQKTKIIKQGLPRFYHGNSTCIMLIHGWTGCPEDLNSIGQKLNTEGGYTVDIPRLPGHGTNLKDMENTGANIWLRYVMDRYLELSYKYEDIYMAGESMGGLICLLSAIQFKIPKIVLFAPAIATISKGVYWAPLLKHIIKRVPSKVDRHEQDDEDTLLYKSEYKQNTSVQTVAELNKLIKLTRHNLSRLQSKALVFWSKKDKSVSSKALDILNNKTPKTNIQYVILEESGHLVTNGPEKEIVLKKTLDFFKQG